VTNTWNNRIAGDDILNRENRYTEYPVRGYSATLERAPYTEDDLLPSGLLGPVKITFGREK